MIGTQLGQDMMVEHNVQEGLTHRAAVTFDYAYSAVDFNDRLRPLVDLDTHTGSMQARSVGVGLTYTLMNEDKGYIDLVGQFSTLHNNFSDVYGDEAKQSAKRLSASVEVGQPIAKIGDWSIEPQAQLSYMQTHYQDFKDTISSVDGYKADALRGRVGARIFRDETPSSKDQSQYYGIINLVHDFTEPKAMTIGDIQVKEDFSRTHLEIGAGLNQQLDTNTFFYADARYQHSLDKLHNEGIALNLGIKVKF